MSDPANNIAATNAYSRVGNLQGPGQPGTEPASGPDFGDVLRQTVRDNISTIREGEKASAQAITGEANIVDVVGAVGKAELTLETIVAVRDRVIQAYNDIISMPI